MTSNDEIWAQLAKAKAAGAEYNSENESRTFSRCLPETRVDLLNTLCTFMERDNRKVFWLFGEAGSGKSSVAYTVADRLRAKGQLAATYFFSLKHTDLNNPKLIYLTLAYQIGEIHPRAKEAIVKAIRDDPELLTDTTSREEQLECLVKAPLRELGCVWDAKRNLILDAADEGGPRMKPTILALATVLRDTTIPISHILITSRPYPPLVNISQGRDFADLVSPIHIEEFDATQDVQLFLRHSFDEIYENRDLCFLHPAKPWPSQAVLSSLSRRIGGRFIVAATVARLIGNSERPSDRLNLLSNLYDGSVDTIDINLGNIDSLYHYILSDCEPSDRRAGVECLSDIIALPKPLPTSTICQIFGSDIQKRINHLSAIISVPPMDSSYETVTTYHASLRDYLWDSSRSLELHVDESSSHSRLLCMCFRLGIRERGNGEGGRVIDEYGPDLKYALENWTHHLTHAKANNEIQGLLVAFLKTCLAVYIGMRDGWYGLSEAEISLCRVRDIISLENI